MIKFVLHSHDNYRRANPNRNSCASLPRQHDMRFSIRNVQVRFQFTRYQNEISHQSENFIRNENGNVLLTVPFICAEIIALVKWELMRKLVLSIVNTC